MKKKLLILPVALALMLFNSPSLLAGTAIQEMVGIMLHLNHHPNSDEKDSLQKIADDNATSVNERTIAEALKNMNHKVSDEDKAKLEKIADDSSASMEDRKVAGILATIHHHPSASDREELEKLR